MRRVWIPVIIAMAVAPAACGKSTIRPDGAERSVVNVVSEQTGFKPKDVSCPSGVEAKVGETFECSFTGPEGPYTARMEVRKVDGEEVLFGVKTRPKSR